MTILDCHQNTEFVTFAKILFFLQKDLYFERKCCIIQNVILYQKGWSKSHVNQTE